MTEEQNKKISDTVQKERKNLFGFIRKRVNSSEDAQDILQDVFYSFIKVYRNFETIEQTSSWLYQVARNKITDLYRKKKEKSLEDEYQVHAMGISFEELLPGIQDNTPEDDITKDLIWESLSESLEELPTEQRDVFIMHELEGLSFNDISVKTGVSVNTLLSRKRYAVHYLRQKLNELFNEIKSM